MAPKSDPQAFQALFPVGLLLLEGSCTLPHETPWGGLAIAQLKGLSSASSIGESWEISTHERRPSRVATASLREVVREFPAEILGAESQSLGHTELPILVKLLNAASHLSFQVHPADDNAPQGKRGKEEAWFIIAAAPGAGIFIGLREGIDEREMKRALLAEEDVSSFFHFMPVRPGEVYCVRPGTPHAIGAGVFLLEVQQSSDVTYRYWDWNREPRRELHIDEALAVTNWDLPRGREILSVIKPALRQSENHRRTLVTSKYFIMEDLALQAGDACEVETNGSFLGMTVIRGEFSLASSGSPGKRVKLAQGYSALIPAATVVVEVTSKSGAQAILTRPAF